MNLLDFVLVVLVVYSAVRGFRQGALSQVAAFGGAVIGIVVGANFAPDLASAMVEGPGSTLALVTLGLLLASFIIGQGIGFAIGLRLRAAAAGLGAAPVDRTAGVAVGLITLVVTIWLLGSAFSQGPLPSIAQQVRGSAVIGAIDRSLPPAPDVFGRVGAYFDQQGFPQVFSGIAGGPTSPPVDPPTEGAVAAAAGRGQVSTVQVQAPGCGQISAGSGFVTQDGFVVTNAHVIAGGESISVRDAAGEHPAEAVLFDGGLDLAVLRAPGTQATPIGWTAAPAGRGVQGATLGFPGGQRELMVKPATVRDRHPAVGRDIYGRGTVNREVLTLAADVRRGDSGGPFVTSEGLVGGVVFAAAPAAPGTGYALTAESVQPLVSQAIAQNATVGTGPCRF
ncbi:MAG TPA: MarP family serine protease [Egibacteraceae bacterium]|nr:MarP family serine protease [Egibacteraceae bacterium]